MWYSVAAKPRRRSSLNREVGRAAAEYLI